MKSNTILLVFIAIAFIGSASAYCSYSQSLFFGYVCDLHNVTATNVYDWIDLSGDHIDGKTNEHVDTVFVRVDAVLQEIPMVIFATFFNLQMFSISGNSLRRIDLPFCGPRLKTLQIIINPITSLQNGAFRGCGSLESILLFLTSIETIEEDVFQDLPLLREAEILGNLVGDVIVGRHIFRYQSQLEFVRLNLNRITAIQPGALQCKEFLEILYLQGNSLEIIATGTFTNLLRLRTLNLGSNAIRVIEEGAFANIPQLESLELIGNQITVLHSDIFGTTFPKLQYLGLGWNQITAVDRLVFKRFSALQSFIGISNICFSYDFDYIESFELDVFPHLETCFSNFDDL